MPFSWEKIKKPIVALAPMAGYTESSFRQIAKEICPGIICFSELTSINAIKFGNEKTKKRLDFEENEYPLIMQLFGNNIKFFIEAGKKLEQLGVAGIDINMGCPARKIVYAEQGSALLKDWDLAAEIVHKLSSSVKIPVSVKTRLGYSEYEPDKLIAFTQKLEEAGAKLLTLHGRTKTQAFSGKADWEPIYMVKKHLKIPVIGNGDITSAEIAKEKLKNLDGVMIGRATFGNPWILAEIYAKLNHKKFKSPATIQEKIPAIKKHLFLNIEKKGEKHGVITMRKHLCSYIKGFENASPYRQRLLAAEKSPEILAILDEINELPHC